MPHPLFGLVNGLQCSASVKTQGVWPLLKHMDLSFVNFSGDLLFIRNQQHEHTKPDMHPRLQTIAKRTPESLRERKK